MDHFPQVLGVIWDARLKYSNLGLSLGLSAATVGAIEKSCHYQVEECFKEVLKVRLQNGLSKQDLADALKSKIVGFGILADKVLSIKVVTKRKQVQTTSTVCDKVFTELDHLPVKNFHLSLLEWSDGAGTGTVRIYDNAAFNWKVIAQMLGLGGGDIVCIDKNQYDERSRLTTVFQRWFENANGLPNAKRYPKKWSGLIKVLYDSQLGELAVEVKKALKAPYNTVRGNLEL